uniref:Uncharacterized protein n=1 Tax=Arundo donax TaxID=35708 RepID=A0A0A9GTI7_ARUDO
MYISEDQLIHMGTLKVTQNRIKGTGTDSNHLILPSQDGNTGLYETCGQNFALIKAQLHPQFCIPRWFCLRVCARGAGDGSGPRRGRRDRAR